VVKKSAAIKDSQWALQKSAPGAVLAADRSGIKTVAAPDVVDDGIAHLKSEIVQGTDDAIAAPSWVFCDQFDDEFFKFRIQGRSTDWLQLETQFRVSEFKAE